jgi:hypothetical protein
VASLVGKVRGRLSLLVGDVLCPQGHENAHHTHVPVDGRPVERRVALRLREVREREVEIDLGGNSTLVRMKRRRWRRRRGGRREKRENGCGS